MTNQHKHPIHGPYLVVHLPKEMVVNKGRVPLDNVQVSLVVVVILMVIMELVMSFMVVMVVEKGVS